ncbi:MAG: PLP-dependent lyase/thiolase [Ilumatobacteraceae bacterium]
MTEPGRPMRVTGWCCVACGATVDIATPFPWRCPNSTDTDRHHVLQIVDDTAGAPVPVVESRMQTHRSAPNALLEHDGDLAWAAFAAVHGMDATERGALVDEVETLVRSVDGAGFDPTPFARSGALSDALGFADGGGVWVKDETGGVGGSHKARHLVTILLHLLAAERSGLLPDRPPLAIASCGNAALAAATLARAVDWPLDVFVPTWMSDGFGSELDRLGARVHRSERRSGDPAGDPAMLRFRDAVAAGAIPFTVQGPENALALDGGRTIGWEICAQAGHASATPIDRVFVQVGGGAFAACLGAAMNSACRGARLVPVQAEGCAPLARAWDRAGMDVELGVAALATQWDELMTPWSDPQSLADGILDDETYDWLGVFGALERSGSAPVVASEADIAAAHVLARSAGFDASPTGTAGLAGLLAVIDTVQPTERVVVVMSGIAR